MSENTNSDVPPPVKNCVYAQHGIHIPTRTAITVCARTLESCEKPKNCGFEINEGECDVNA